MGPARRRRRLGRAHAQGLGEGAPALGGPRWATLPRAGVGLGVAGPGGGEKGKRGEGRLRLGYARVGHAPKRGGGVGWAVRQTYSNSMHHSLFPIGFY
jgi:hypothetical protein